MNIDTLASGTDGLYPSIKWCYDQMTIDFQNISGYIDGTTSGINEYNKQVPEIMVKFYKNFAGTIVTHIQNYGQVKVPVIYAGIGGTDYDAIKIQNVENGLDGFIVNAHVDDLTSYTISGSNEISGTIL